MTLTLVIAEDEEPSREHLRALAAALSELHVVAETGDGHAALRLIDELRPDVAFNALHGPFGEDGTIQGILEYLAIPYTHSGVLASALAMDKAQAKKIAKAAGIPVAESKVVNRFTIGEKHPMPAPYVVKPVNEGSSFGVVIVKEDRSHPPQIIASSEWRYGDMVMVERYVHGRVVLAGDAAHVHSPAGGQGMNTGIQDAANLAWKVALVERGAAGDALVATYDAERHPVGAMVLRASGLMLRGTMVTGLARSVREREVEAHVQLPGAVHQLDVGVPDLEAALVLRARARRRDEQRQERNEPATSPHQTTQPCFSRQA